MPTETEKAASALEDYVELFDALARFGIELVVIGGCAVGAYARLVGETVFSADLDILVTERTLESMIEDSGALGLEVEKLPRPRNVPVAVFRWRGHEVNALTASEGLAPADIEARTARELELGHTRVLIADPFDLLRNKLAVNRPKDQPHIALLRRFLDEEAVHGFVHEIAPRDRIGPAERLLTVLGAQTLAESLGARLVPLAREPADFRFLAHRLPTRALLDALLARAPSEDVGRFVESIAGRRGLR